MDPLDELRVFTTILEAGSLAAAARRLRRSSDRHRMQHKRIKALANILDLIALADALPWLRALRRYDQAEDQCHGSPQVEVIGWL